MSTNRIEIDYSADDIKEVRVTKENIIIVMLDDTVYTASPNYSDDYMERNFERVLFSATLNRIKNGCRLFENVESTT